MKDLNLLTKQCMEEQDALNIPYGRKISIRSNNRLTASWGYCKLKNGEYDISIAERLLCDDVPDNAIKSVIHHELLHTIKKCLNHSPKWKGYAAKLSSTYGYPIRRAVSAKEMGMISEKKAETSYKHKYVCENCGAVILRKRESKFTKYYKHYRCGKCKGKFVKVF